MQRHFMVLILQTYTHYNWTTGFRNVAEVCCHWILVIYFYFISRFSRNRLVVWRRATFLMKHLVHYLSCVLLLLLNRNFMVCIDKFDLHQKYTIQKLKLLMLLILYCYEFCWFSISDLINTFFKHIYLNKNDYKNTFDKNTTELYRPVVESFLFFWFLSNQYKNTSIYIFQLCFFTIYIILVMLSVWEWWRIRWFYSVIWTIT